MIRTETCRACKGAGEIWFNDTNPYGHGPDPQCDDAYKCDQCGGTGETRIGPPDPLDVLAGVRKCRGHWWWESGYRRACRVAMQPVRLP